MGNALLFGLLSLLGGPGMIALGLTGLALGLGWRPRRRRGATRPRPPTAPAMQVHRPRRYSSPPPYRPVSNRREDRRR